MEARAAERIAQREFQMRGKVRILGATFPAWAIAVAMILAASGAAAGTVLAGKVTGTISATASQALLIRFPSAGTFITEADADLMTVSDDGTGFTAAAEINSGDFFRVHLALANESNSQLNGELTLVGPDGITFRVEHANDVVPYVVRTGPFTWRFRLNPTTDDTQDMVITVALADDLLPGFYAIDGSLKQIAQ
jgi:hypothetical protein